MSSIYERGQKVHVSGEVEWGMNTYRVCTDGVVEEDTGQRKLLITLEEVDGDFGVCIYVPRNMVKDFNEHMVESANPALAY